MELGKLSISAYIPCYNGARYLGRAIESLLSQTLAPSEVIVIDDGSRDGSSEVAGRHPVRVVKHRANRGLARARNTAVRAARFPFVASIDVDCEAEAHWLERLLKRIEETGAAGVCGRVVEPPPGALADFWRSVHMMRDWGERAACSGQGPAVDPDRNSLGRGQGTRDGGRGTWDRTQGTGHRVQGGTDFPPHILGSNSLFRRDALLDVGLYDARFRTNAEDADISRRLRRAGYALLYEPDALVFHRRRDTILSVLDCYWRWHFFGFREDITLTSTLASLVVDIRTAASLFLEDVRSGRLSLLGLDLCAGAYAFLRDAVAFLDRRLG